MVVGTWLDRDGRRAGALRRRAVLQGCVERRQRLL
jgi:hypothetical protein